MQNIFKTNQAQSVKCYEILKNIGDLIQNHQFETAHFSIKVALETLTRSKLAKTPPVFPQPYWSKI